jgi:hypothetical protein
MRHCRVNEIRKVVPAHLVPAARRAPQVVPGVDHVGVESFREPGDFPELAFKLLPFGGVSERRHG